MIFSFLSLLSFFLLVLPALVTSIAAKPISKEGRASGSDAVIDTLRSQRQRCAVSKPKCYRFNDQFPSKSSWLDWDCLVALNRGTIARHNGPVEVNHVIEAVKVVAAEAGIDP